ncbi:MAG: M23 family metallopeptidase [Deltaproteobacteria bacterium]|nr:M23 family metallopeptidase [Deltaproteobacteria bacterium]
MRSYGRWLLLGLWLLPAGILAQPAPAEPEVFVQWYPEQPGRGDPLVVEVRLEGEGAADWKIGATFLKHRLAFFPWGEQQRALAPIAVTTEAGTHPLQVVLTRGEGEARQTLERTVGVPVAEVEFEQSTLRVSPRFTSPPKQARARIRRERALIKKAWRKQSDQRLWRGAFQRPMTTEVTGVFGTERVFNDKVESRHLGLDLDGKTGDPIQAVAGGRVVLAGHLFYTGRCVFIDHGLGLFSVYFHMSELKVAEGDRVEKGQVIGLVGRSGRVTGPHLHFGAKLQGVYVRPSTLFALPLGDDPGA